MQPVLFSQSLPNSLFFAMQHFLFADNKKPCPSQCLCQCQCQSWIYIAHKRKASNALEWLHAAGHQGSVQFCSCSAGDAFDWHGDKTCICSTVNNVFFAVNQAEKLSIPCPCITYDLCYGWKPLTLPEQKSWIVLFAASVGFICS